MSEKGGGHSVSRAFDKYTMQARVAPALIVVLPLVAASAAWVPKLEDIVRPLIIVFMTMGAAALLAQVARDAGKKAEKNLLSQWGGWPSTIMLRHRDLALNPIDKQRYHDALGKLVPGVKMPTASEEEQSPEAADHVYEACCTWLRSQTVDEHRFHRLFAENMAYGFRRNLYGMRKVAFASTFIGFVACIAKIIVNIYSRSQIGPIPIICLGVCVVLGGVFALLLTPAGLRQTGDDYAKRLLGAIDELSDTKTKPRSRRTKQDDDTD